MSLLMYHTVCHLAVARSLQSAFFSKHCISYDSGPGSTRSGCTLSRGRKQHREKNVFGGRGFLSGSTTFAIVWDHQHDRKDAARGLCALLSEPGIHVCARQREADEYLARCRERLLIADDPELADG